MTEHTITLWGMPQSPFVQKVMIVLDEMDLDYQHIPALPTRFINHSTLCSNNWRNQPLWPHPRHANTWRQL